MTTIARSVTADIDDGLFIDGIKFPWAVGLDVSIEHEPGGITTVWLPLLVDGVATIRTETERTVTDAEPFDGLGDVGLWARRCVRAGLRTCIPWLRVNTGGGQ